MEMGEVIKLGFMMYLKPTDEKWKVVCRQTYSLKLGEKRRVTFYSREYELYYYDNNGVKEVNIHDCEDWSTSINFHSNIVCTSCSVSLNTWDEELLSITLITEDSDK